MLAGNLIDLGKHLESNDAELILKFIKNIGNNEPQVGTWVGLSETLKVLLLDKSNYNKGVFESHKVYKDIHILIRGKDTLHFADHTSSTLLKSYDEKGDYSLHDSVDLFQIELRPNSFVLVNQNEQHSNEITEPGSLKTSR